MRRAIPIALALVLCSGALPATADEIEEEVQGAEPTEEGPGRLSIGFGIDLFSLEREPGYRKLKVLDLLLVSAVEMESRDPDQYELEVLSAPFVSGYHNERDGEKTSLRVLSVPFFSLFQRDREGDDKLKIQVLKLPLIGALYFHERDGGHRKTRVLYLISRESSN